MTVFNSGVDAELAVYPGRLRGQDVICIGFEISKPLICMGNISPKLEKIKTFTVEPVGNVYNS